MRRRLFAVSAMRLRDAIRNKGPGRGTLSEIPDCVELQAESLSKQVQFLPTAALHGKIVWQSIIRSREVREVVDRSWVPAIGAPKCFSSIVQVYAALISVNRVNSQLIDHWTSIAIRINIAIHHSSNLRRAASIYRNSAMSNKSAHATLVSQHDVPLITLCALDLTCFDYAILTFYWVFLYCDISVRPISVSLKCFEINISLTPLHSPLCCFLIILCHCITWF